jgi:hypothetical protein
MSGVIYCLAFHYIFFALFSNTNRCLRALVQFRNVLHITNARLLALDSVQHFTHYLQCFTNSSQHYQ